MARDETPAMAQGRAAEDLALAYLGDRGLTLVTRNFRCHAGEIDLILEQGSTLIFVEVRYRERSDFGTPAETVDARKRAKLRATAEYYLQQRRGGSKKACRFDIVAIHGHHTAPTVEWLPNAF